MSSTDVEVRPANPDDVSRLAHVGRHAFIDAYAAHSEKDDLAVHLEEHFSERAVSRVFKEAAAEYLLASIGEVAVGLAKFRETGVPKQLDARSAIEVQQLYVSSDHQRRGVGRLLMDEVVSISRKRGVDGIWLSVWEEADWATGFYRRYGYREAGKVNFQLGASNYVDCLMWLPIVNAL